MRHRMSILAVVVFLAASAAFAQYGEAKSSSSTEPAHKRTGHMGMQMKHDETIVVAAGKSSALKTFDEWVKSAGLAATLEGTGPYTVFAPTDEALNKLPKEQMDALKSDKTKLAEFLKGYVVEGQALTSTQIVKMNGQKVKTLEGNELAISSTGSKEMVGNAGVTGRQIVCKNGVIHEIDAVIAPSMAAPASATPAPQSPAPQTPSTPPVGGTGK